MADETRNFLLPLAERGELRGDVDVRQHAEALGLKVRRDLVDRLVKPEVDPFAETKTACHQFFSSIPVPQ